MISQETTAASEKAEGTSNNNHCHSKADDTCLDSTIDQQTNKSWWGGVAAVNVIRPSRRHSMTDNRGTAAGQDHWLHRSSASCFRRSTPRSCASVMLFSFPTERPSRYMNVSGYSDENTYKAPGN